MRSLIDVECSLSQGYSLFKDLALALSRLKYSRSSVGKQIIMGKYAPFQRACAAFRGSYVARECT
jgi:hypothetical protein